MVYVGQRHSSNLVQCTAKVKPFDHKARISGNNLFVSAYHGFATLGNEHTPSPVPFEPFPSFIVRILGASATDGTLYLNFKLETDNPNGRYRLLTKIRLPQPGGGRNPGAMRNYLANGTANDALVTASIPDYVTVSGLDLSSYQVHSPRYDNRIPQSVSRSIRRGGN